MKYLITTALICTGSLAQAVPISLVEGPIAGFTSGTFTNASDEHGAFASVPDPTFNRESQSLDTGSQTNTYTTPNGNTGASFANSSTGQVGTIATLNNDGIIDTGASLFDILTFDFGGAASGNISYSLAVDGFLTDSDNTALSGLQQVFFYDVTGMADPFKYVSVSPAPGRASESGFVIANDGASLVSFATLGNFVYPNGSTTCSLISSPTNTCSTATLGGSPSLFSFSDIIGDTFTATAGNQYALVIESFSGVSGLAPATSDLFSTATFSFTDLSGGTFSSDSTTFLSASNTPVSPVPVPASLPLLIAGLAGLGVLSRRRKSH